MENTNEREKDSREKESEFKTKERDSREKGNNNKNTNFKKMAQHPPPEAGPPPEEAAAAAAAPADHGQFIPPIEHKKVVNDALSVMLKSAYPIVHHGAETTMEVLWRPDRSGIGGIPTLTVHMLIDASNAYGPIMYICRSGKRNKRGLINNAKKIMIENIMRCLRAHCMAAGSRRVIPQFLIVTRNSDAENFWKNELINDIMKQIRRQHPSIITKKVRFDVVRPPRGPPSQPGLYEDQLIVDIAHTIVRVLQTNPDPLAGRVTIVTADGNKRKEDAEYVPGVDGAPSVDFPTFLEISNHDFQQFRADSGMAAYNPVSHETPTKMEETNGRFKDKKTRRLLFGT